MQPTRLALGVLLAAAGVAHADLTFTPSATYTAPDSRKNSDNEVGYNIALGYRFTPAIAVELVHGRTESTLHGGTKKHIISQIADRDTSDSRLGLDAYYAFMTEEAISPYVLIGAGEERYKTNAPNLQPNGKPNSTENFQDLYVNAGVGAFYHLTNRIALRGEYRLVHNADETLFDNMVLLGLQFATSGAAAPAPAAQPEPTPEPTNVVEQAVAPVVVAPPADTDKDGVPDTADQCANTVAGAKVDANGCELDTDKDGVADSADKCPDTKAGAAVDATGCYEMLKQEVDIALNVTFASGKADIQGDATAEVQKVADFMKKYPNVNVTIEGHTDNRGNAAKNKALSQKRADAVKAELVKLGVDATRLSAVGYGSAQPVADNKTEADRAQNRRVVASAKPQTQTIKMKKK